MDPSAPGLGFSGGPVQFSSAPVGYQMPFVPDPGDQKGIYVKEIYDRLKWPLLDIPGTAEIVDLDSNGEAQWRPLLGHTFAETSMTSPPRSRMLVVLSLVHDGEFWQDAEAMDNRPPPLLMENIDGRPISLAQVITKLHDCTIRLRDLIYEIGNRELDDCAHLYFSGISKSKRGGPDNADALFRVHVLSDIVQNDPMGEEMWVRKAQRFTAQQCTSP